MAKEPKKEKKENPETKDKPGRSSKQKGQAASLPIILEASFTFSRIAILFIGVSTFSLTVLSGGSPLMASMRGGIAVFTVGCVVWTGNWFLSKITLDALKPDVNNNSDKNLVESNVEKQA
jgi:hypothetical protein